MKKHLVMICGIYYPDPSATGQCAKQYVKLLYDEYDIEVICMSDDGATRSVTDENGFAVHILTGKRMAAEYRSRNIIKKCYHILGGLQIKTKLLGNLNWFRRAAYKKLCEINGRRKIDVVFTVCSPFAAHFAGMDFKAEHPNIVWCGYTVDPYADRKRTRPFWCSFERLVALECRMNSTMDSLLVSEEIYNNRPELYLGSKRCNYLPYLLPENKTAPSASRRFDPNDINCVYAGSLYHDIRNPESMLSYFSKLSNEKIKLHLYTWGCEDMVEGYAKKSNRIILHDRVSADEILELYSEADVLVNIGNSTPEFKPSKTFEYISTGKPIIHFYYDGMRDDTLDKYPHCLQIQIGDKEISPDELLNFISENRNKKIAPDEIQEIYIKHSRQNICEILLNSFDQGDK